MAVRAKGLSEEILTSDGLHKVWATWVAMPPDEGIASLALVEIGADRQVCPTCMTLRKMLAQEGRR